MQISEQERRLAISRAKPMLIRAATLHDQIESKKAAWSEKTVELWELAKECGCALSSASLILKSHKVHASWPEVLQSYAPAIDDRQAVLYVKAHNGEIRDLSQLSLPFFVNDSTVTPTPKRVIPHWLKIGAAWSRIEGLMRNFDDITQDDAQKIRERALPMAKMLWPEKF